MTYKTYYFNHLSFEIKGSVMTKFSYFADNLSEGTEAPPLEHMIAIIKAAFLSNRDNEGNFDFYDQVLKNDGQGWKMTARTQDPPPLPKPPTGIVTDLALE